MADMGINGSEFLVIALIAVLIVGPEKLPELAAQLGRVVRELKDIAQGAKKRVEDELGPDFEELKSLDPRQYDPRRIVRDALRDEPPVHHAPSRIPTSTSLAAGGIAGSATTATVSGANAASTVNPADVPTGESEVSQPPRPTVPFDDEAT